MKDYHAFTQRSKDILMQLKSPTVVSYAACSKNVEALWDTGASFTCISRELAFELGAVAIGQRQIITPSGFGIVNTFIVDIELPSNLLIRNIPVCDSEIKKQGFDVLIGMDIISLGDFSVSNFGGNTTFSFVLPSLHEVDYVQELKDARQVPRS